MTAWDSLARELDLWGDAGKTAAFWWRDDDAVAPGEALERLLSLSGQHSAGLGLAVIPAHCDSALPEVLKHAAQRSAAEISVLQHGIAHQNRAPAGEKKTELTSAVPLGQTLEGLKAGQERLSKLFGPRLLPVLVPPWNRIAQDITAQLPACGFSGFSTYKARSHARPVANLLQVNTHADLLRWKPERGFLGEAEVLSLLQVHLEQRRGAQADPDEPTGILTHHLVHDQATWSFLDRLLGWLGQHPATKILAPSEAFSHSARTNSNQVKDATGKSSV